MRHRFTSISFIFTIILIIPIVLVALHFFETTPPSARLITPLHLLGKEASIEICCTDGETGLRNVSFSVIQGGEKHFVRDINIAKRGINKKTLKIALKAADLNLDDGKAAISITVTDRSFLKNASVLTIPVTIDTTPPAIALYPGSTKLKTGGTGAIRYSCSSDTVKSHIVFEGNTFKGYSLLPAEGQYVSYFAVPLYPENSALKICVFAYDKAGNRGEISLSYKLLRGRAHSDNIVLSDSFVNDVVKSLPIDASVMESSSDLRIAVYANNTLRNDNIKSIMDICSNSVPEKLWRGNFLKLHNSIITGRFGDLRRYTFKNSDIGHSVHCGIDLASVRTAPIPASNSGIVVYADSLGIFGNTVIIDHGYSVFSLYAHLSEFSVQKQEIVSRGEIIGRTGNTGLSAGDHLHFSMIVGKHFVDPEEWFNSSHLKLTFD